MEKKFIKVKGEIMWAFTNKPSDMSGSYQVDLCNLSPAAVDALEEVGIAARRREDKPEKGFFVTAKSKYPITVLDKDGDPITDQVGNGSKGIGVVSVYEWKYKNKSGKSLSIGKLIVTDLKVYEKLGEGVDASELEEAL